MDLFWSETPIILQFIPSINKSLIVFLNRLGQILIFLFAIQALYETRIYNFSIGYLARIGRFYRYLPLIIEIGPSIGLYFGAEAKGKRDVGLPIYLLLSAAIILLFLFVTEHGLLYWLVYPFLQLKKAIIIWNSIEFKIWSILLTFLICVLYLCWAYISVAIVTIPAFFIPSKTTLLLVDHISRRFSPRIYRFLLIIELAIGSGLVLLTTGVS